MDFEVIIVLILIDISLAESKYCWHTTKYGKTSHFYCGAFEYCCGTKCCENFSEFYKLWYFWLCVLIVITSCAVGLYWLHRRFMSTQPDRPRTLRRILRYQPLQGEANSALVATPSLVVPPTVIMTPPPYNGDNTGVCHLGPPPYSLGSGSSINSQTVPRNPPSYQQIEKEPPPSYSSVVKLVMEESQMEKESGEPPS